MIIPIPVYIAIYIVGVILSFDVLTTKLNRKFPKLKYDLGLKFWVIIISCFSFLSLWFIILNDDLND